MLPAHRPRAAIAAAAVSGLLIGAQSAVWIGAIGVAFPILAGATAAIAVGIAARNDWASPRPIAMLPTALLVLLVLVAGLQAREVPLPAAAFVPFVIGRVLVVAAIGFAFGVYGGAKRPVAA